LPRTIRIVKTTATNNRIMLSHNPRSNFPMTHPRIGSILLRFTAYTPALSQFDVPGLAPTLFRRKSGSSGSQRSASAISGQLFSGWSLGGTGMAVSVSKG
jgi:hypothetical protein